MKPIEQFREYLIELDLWSMKEEEEFISSVKEEVKSALDNAEKKIKPNWKELFNDVYFEMPNHVKYVLISKPFSISFIAFFFMQETIKGNGKSRCQIRDALPGKYLQKLISRKNPTSCFPHRRKKERKKYKTMYKP